jgi:hypothetical protein
MTQELDVFDNDKKNNLLEKLIEYNGIVTTACKAANLSRAIHYVWYNSDATYKQNVDDIQEMVIDFVEGYLYELIKKGDTAATLFYLKTRGKKRGFIERNDDQLPPVIITTTVSKEEAIEIYKTINEQC